MSQARKKGAPKRENKPNQGHILTIRLNPNCSAHLKATRDKYRKNEGRSVTYNEIVCRSIMSFQ